MSTARLNALPKRRERHFDGRVLWCFEERASSVWAGFECAARRTPDHPALVFEDQTWTYGELETEARRIATGLAALGVAPGDRVVMQIRNRPEFVTLFYAIQLLAAVAVPVDVRLQGPEIAHVVNDCGARVFLHDADMHERARTACSSAPGLLALALPEPGQGMLFPEVHPSQVAQAHAVVHEESVAIIMYTSGTTGRPKGAAIAHMNVAHSFLHHAVNLGLSENDRCVVAVPLSHITGLLCGVVAPLWCSGTLTLLPYFKAREFLPAAVAAQMTYTIMVPAMYNLCLRVEGFDWATLASWRLGHFGGAPMPSATIEALAERLPGLTLVNGYGATETCSPAIMLPVGDGPTDIDSVGRALACVELLVMDPETCVEVPTGESGELWVRGPMVIEGYWNDPEATRKGIVGGYWRSGDIGCVDAAGNVRVLDRLKDLINRGGYKIYSAEVEEVLSRCPGVVESAIVGRADPVLGERVHAFVCVTSGVTQAHLKSFCAEHLGDYKIPESWSVSTAPILRNANGKLAKNELRALAAALT